VQCNLYGTDWDDNNERETRYKYCPRQAYTCDIVKVQGNRGQTLVLEVEQVPGSVEKT